MAAKLEPKNSIIVTEMANAIYQGPAGKDGKTPVKGIDYFDGKDGKDGKDYVLTDEDKQEIANLVDTSGFTTEEDVIALIAEYGGGTLPASEEGEF